MTPFVLLSAPVRACLALWALLLCLVNLGSAVLAAVRRRGRCVVLALLLLAPVYLLWQVIFDLSLFGASEQAAALSRALGRFPWLCWLAALGLLTLGAGLLLGDNLRYDKRFLHPGAIKRFLDQLPCGVCCWQESGRVLFSNVRMNRLCAALTKAPLLNGSQLRDAVQAGILTVEGRVWRFSCRELNVDGQRLQELIASDISSEYAKTQALERDKAERSRMNRQLRDYYHGIDEIVRRQEILQARVNIHEEMNRLMLSTTAADREDTAALDRVFSLWEQNALLFCMEADSTAEPMEAERLEKLAAALKLRLVWARPLPEALTASQRALFFSAAREAMVNAVKHAAAKTLTIRFDEGAAGLCCRFTNDGALPASPVRFTGGLANLSLLAKQQGAAVSVRCAGQFTLVLEFF